MNNIKLSEEAQNDLVEIKKHIEEDLMNPSAALKTVSKITKSLRILQTFAQAGPALSSVTDVVSDYRYMVSGSYVSFYRTYGENVYVDRIIHARRDYMRVLFENTVTDEIEE